MRKCHVGQLNQIDVSTPLRLQNLRHLADAMERLVCISGYRPLISILESLQIFFEVDDTVRKGLQLQLNSITRSAHIIY